MAKICAKSITVIQPLIDQRVLQFYPCITCELVGFLRVMNRVMNYDMYYILAAFKYCMVAC